MVSMLSYTAMSVVDTIFVSRLGTPALAGIGLAATMVYLVHSFGNGLLQGLKVAISHRTGAGEDCDAQRLAWQGLWLSGVMGVVVAATGGLGPIVFPLFGVSDAVSDLASGYFRIRVLGAPLLFAIMAMSSWFHGRGDTRTPMIATLLSNAVNIAFDPILIFGMGVVPAYGLEGAAASSVLGFGVGVSWLAVRIHRELRGSCPSLSPIHFREMTAVGSPIGLRFFLEVASYVVFAVMLARIGDANLAAHVLVVRLTSLSFLPGYAIGDAVSVLVGQSIGAGRAMLARIAWRRGLELAVVIMAFWAVVFCVMPQPLLSVFGPDAVVAEIATDLLFIAAAFQVIDAVAMVSLGALNGAGDTRYTMWVAVGSTWLVKLPVGYVLAAPVGLGAAGAWLGLTMEIALVAAFVLMRIRGDTWLQKHESEKEKSASGQAEAQAAK